MATVIGTGMTGDGSTETVIATAMTGDGSMETAIETAMTVDGSTIVTATIETIIAGPGVGPGNFIGSDY